MFRRKTQPNIKTISYFVLIAFSLASLLSCGSVPTQTYVKRSQLSNINHVALNVSSVELDVKHSRHSGMSPPTAFLSMLGGGLLFPPLENVIEGIIDSKYAKRFEGTFSNRYFEKVLRDYFLGYLETSKLFDIKNVDKKSYQEMVKEGYDAIIELKIDELSLRRLSENDLKVYACVWATMVDLRNENIIWKRLEHLDSEEAYTLDTYLEENAKILRKTVDNILNKLAYRLSVDILYSK